MSDNMYTTPYQPSTNQSYSRPRLTPDPGHNFPSMRDNQFNPLMRDQSPVQSSLPRFPAASLSHGEVLRQIHENSPSSHPSLSNLKFRHTASSGTRDALLSHLKPRLSSSDNASLKRDLDSAFGGGSSLGPSVEREMGPQTGWFPDIPKDDRRRFLLQQSGEDFEHQCRMHALRAKWSYDQMIDNENRAIKAEEEAYILRCQIDQVQAILDEERLSKEQVQASLKEERKLRKEADRRVKELEEKLVAVDKERAQEQGHPGMESSVKVITGSAANVDESQEPLHLILEPAAVEREQEQEQGPAGLEPLVKVSTGMNANIDEHQELGDNFWTVYDITANAWDKPNE